MKNLAKATMCTLMSLIITSTAVGTDIARAYDEYMYGFGLTQKTYLPEGTPKVEIFEIDRIECGGPAAQAQLKSGDIILQITIRDKNDAVLPEPLTRLSEEDVQRTADVIVVRPLDPDMAVILQILMESERKIIFSGPVTGENKCE